MRGLVRAVRDTHSHPAVAAVAASPSQPARQVSRLHLDWFPPALREAGDPPDSTGSEEVQTPRVAMGGAAARGAQRHRLDAIGVWSVARVALLFYLGVLAAIVLGVCAAWFAASQVGAVSGFEEFMQSMGFGDFRLLSWNVILGVSMIAAVVVTMWVVLTITAAGLYNAIALPWGGVHVTLTLLSDDTTAIVSDDGSAVGSGNGHRTVSSNGGDAATVSSNGGDTAKRGGSGGNGSGRE
jgi:hypothetical protein